MAIISLIIGMRLRQATSEIMVRLGLSRRFRIRKFYLENLFKQSLLNHICFNTSTKVQIKRFPVGFYETSSDIEMVYICPPVRAWTTRFIKMGYNTFVLQSQYRMDFKSNFLSITILNLVNLQMFNEIENWDQHWRCTSHYISAKDFREQNSNYWEIKLIFKMNANNTSVFIWTED